MLTNIPAIYPAWREGLGADGRDKRLRSNPKTPTKSREAIKKQNQYENKNYNSHFGNHV